MRATPPTEQHATELTSLTTRLVDIEAQHARGGVAECRLDRQLHESGAALEDARREWGAEVAALTERLQQRETELGASLADALAGPRRGRETIGGGRGRSSQAQQRSAAALAEAAGETAAIEARLREEISARDRLSKSAWPRLNRARHDADRQHAIELASMADRLAELQAQHEAVVGQRVGIEGTWPLRPRASTRREVPGSRRSVRPRVGTPPSRDGSRMSGANGNRRLLR